MLRAPERSALLLTPAGLALNSSKMQNLINEFAGRFEGSRTKEKLAAQQPVRPTAGRMFSLHGALSSLPQGPVKAPEPLHPKTQGPWCLWSSLVAVSLCLLGYTCCWGRAPTLRGRGRVKSLAWHCSHHISLRNTTIRHKILFL